ncbi:ATP-binding protein [Pseudoduganella armeniaca]|uniref:ATP-binding protein n=1 Tax=Pseudoduganella armeniaca TaxID=2072590 RepID=A0A2R4CI12_9BURK|nr:ATP-binding protein [Pseudoduganella armeniaca]
MGEVPGVPVVDEDEVPVWPLVPEVPVAPLVELVEPLVALEPIVELSLLPLVVSVVLQAARATQNAAANIVFIIAMIFPLVSGLKR